MSVVSTLGSLPSHEARSRGLTERLGRAAVLRALSEIRFGRVELIEPGEAARVYGEEGPRASFRVLRPGVYSALFRSGALGVAEAYMDGLWESDDLPTLIEILAANMNARGRLSPLTAALSAVREAAGAIARRNTRSGSRKNIVAHYDLSDAFFALFLDPSMSYSSAIFERGDETLEAAQTEKIDRACRKLMLAPGDHLLEIGTGWGALAVHAASTYGCRVTTTTISDNQHAAAVERVRAAGLSDRIEVVKMDYRDLGRRFPAAFDKLVSIEMIEAVGHEFLGDYFGVVGGVLKPRGVAVIQAIVVPDQRYDYSRRRIDFLKKYIFPGSCLCSTRAMLDAAQRRSDLRLWHLEDIGPHYATTLARWRSAFLSRLPEVRGLGFDDRFIRMWDYYLSYCEGAFRARSVGDVQMTLVKPMAMAPAFDGRVVSGRE